MPTLNETTESRVIVGNARPDKDFTASACASTYLVMGSFWTLMFALVLASALQGAGGAWLMVGLLGSILVLILLWVGFFRISLIGETLFYRSLWGGTRSLQLSEIKSAEIKIDTNEKFGPPYRLILWPEPSTGKKPIVVNMKVFSRTDLTRVFDFLGSKLQTKRRFSMFSKG